MNVLYFGIACIAFSFGMSTSPFSIFLFLLGVFYMIAWYWVV